MQPVLIPALIFAVPSFIWLVLSQLAKAPLSPAFIGKDILLLISHPDDESMFFGPTLTRLALSPNVTDFKILSLSNGNADGLGERRTLELYNATKYWNFTEDHVIVLNDPKLQDNINKTWDAQYAATVLEEYAKDTDIVITFDKEGISSHPNHVSCYHAALLWKEKSLAKQREVWALETVPVYRKYLLYVDALFAFFTRDPENQNKVLFLNDQYAYERLKIALGKHISQMVWFRQLYMMFSRYMLANELIKQ